MIRPWFLLGAVLAAPSALAQTAGTVALENDYVRVSKDAAPCATAAPGRCEDRVILAMGDVTLRSAGASRQMSYGQIAVFKAGDSYESPAGGGYFEVAVKPAHPPVKSPPELIPPPKNMMVFEGAKFFIYEEKLGRATATASASRSVSTTARACINGSSRTARSPRASRASSTGASRSSTR